jgi:outer membrane protein assembly factor BamA
VPLTRILIDLQPRVARNRTRRLSLAAGALLAALGSGCGVAPQTGAATVKPPQRRSDAPKPAVDPCTAAGAEELDINEVNGKGVADVCIAGGTPTTATAVRRVMRIASGVVLSPEVLRADAAAIYATGLVDDVVITARREGERAIVFVKVDQCPRVASIDFEGLGEGATAVGFRGSASFPERGTPLSLAALGAAKLGLKTAYAEAGWVDADVKTVIEHVGDQQVRLKVLVTEGARAKVGAVIFEGAGGGREASLRKHVGLVDGQPLDQAALDVAFEKAIAFYLDNGYLDARIRPPSITRGPAAGSVVTFKVEEGPPVRVAAIRFSGIDAATEKELLRRMKTKVQAIGRRDIVVSDKAVIRSFFRERGKVADVDVRPTLGPKAATVDLLFDVTLTP